MCHNIRFTFTNRINLFAHVWIEIELLFFPSILKSLQNSLPVAHTLGLPLSEISEMRHSREKDFCVVVPLKHVTTSIYDENLVQFNLIFQFLLCMNELRLKSHCEYITVRVTDGWPITDHLNNTWREINMLQGNIEVWELEKCWRTL